MRTRLFVSFPFLPFHFFHLFYSHIAVSVAYYHASLAYPAGWVGLCPLDMGVTLFIHCIGYFPCSVSLAAVSSGPRGVSFSSILPIALSLCLAVLLFYSISHLAWSLIV